MTRIRFIAPKVKTCPEGRPDACPHCGGGILSKHGQEPKPVIDPHVEEVTTFRFRCLAAGCGKTFRHYPEGIDRADQSQRMRALAGLAWALGMSHRSASHFFAAFGVSLSRMSVWRDVQTGGENARRGMGARTGGRVRVIGADETFAKVKGEQTAVGVVVDAETGEILGLDVLIERGADGFEEWLADYVSELGVETIVTDDLNTYKPVARRLGVDHQVCLAHVKKAVANRLAEIEGEGLERVKAEIWRLLTELPLDGGLLLLRLERAVRDKNDELRRLCVALSDKWRALLCFRRREGVPWTNNMTERAIGRSKIRYKTTREYKSVEGLLNGFGLTQWARSGADGLDLSEPVAA